MAPMSRFELRIDEDLLKRIDEWAAMPTQDQMTRAEAARRLIEIGLAKSGKDGVSISDGEKLLLSMVNDLCTHLEIGRSNVDRDLVMDAIYGGHYWALKWEMTGLLHDSVDLPGDVKHVASVLTMWTALEISYKQLDEIDQASVRAIAEGEPKFPGFDANDETALYSIADFFVNSMRRFRHFADRDLNSHGMGDGYAAMLKAYEPMRREFAGAPLNRKQIVELLQLKGWQ